MNNKKTPIAIGIIAIIIFVATIFYMVKKADNIMTPEEAINKTVSENTQMPTNTNSSDIRVTENNNLNDNLLEGLVISIGEKEVAISNGTSEPDLVGISAITSVVKIKNDQAEIPVGLADISSGSNVKITFKLDSEKKKQAEKIVLVEK